MGCVDALIRSTLAETRFFMPTEQMDTPWYSFDFGVTHFIIISTEHAFAPETAQHNFVVDVWCLSWITVRSRLNDTTGPCRD